MSVARVDEPFDTNTEIDTDHSEDGAGDGQYARWAEQELVTLALGFKPATPEGGIEAKPVMFDDLAALEAVDPESLARNAAAYALLAWLAAHSPIEFGSGPDLLKQFEQQQ